MSVKGQPNNPDLPIWQMALAFIMLMAILFIGRELTSPIMPLGCDNPVAYINKLNQSGNIASYQLNEHAFNWAYTNGTYGGVYCG